MHPDGARLVRLAGSLLLLAGIAAAWLPSLDASFQFDDWNVIVRDARVQSLQAWSASMPGIRPLLKLSYAINHEFGGGPGAFRAVNIGLHAANVLLLLALLTSLGRALGFDATRAAGAALLAATVFALHPVQTEAVTYVSGRSSSMAATACLAALSLWVHGLGRRNEVAWRVASVIAFALALGIKEVAVALPLVMALWLWLAVPAPRQAVARLAPHFALLLGGALVLLAWPSYRHLFETSLATRGIGANLLVQAQAIVYLAGQLLRPGHLNADPMLQIAPGATPAALAAVAALLAAAALAVALRRRHPALAFGVLWFFAWLLPTNSLLARLDIVNDRQLYLALAGPAWVLGLAMLRFAPSRARGDGGSHAPFVALALAVVTGALLAGGTLLRNRAYATEIAFWQDVATKSPHNARAANNLGYAYALECRDAEAEREFSRGVALDRAYWLPGVNRRLLREHALFAVPPPCARHDVKR
jgi:hypothetical protein